MIEVIENVFWNPDSLEQSEDAMQWLNDEVRPNLGEADYDEFSRPHLRAYENDVVEVTEEQIYISESHSWARKGVKYTVKEK